MSLINDALKRAKQAQRQDPSSAPPAQFRPADAAPHSSRPILLIVVVVALLVGAGVLIGMSLQRRASAPNVGAPPKQSPEAAASEDAASTTQPAPAVATVKARVSTAQANVTTTAASVVQPQKPGENSSSTAPVDSSIKPAGSNAVEQAVVPSVPPKPVLPRLQGIFYRPDRPTAVLDGKVVLVGGTLREFRVVAIQRNSVIVVHSGQTNVLSLSE